MADRPALLAKYRDRLDALDAANEAVKNARAAVDEVECEIRNELESSGEWQDGCGIKAPGITVNVVQKWRAKYDPALWPKLVAWAGAHDMAHCVQRRLNDKAIMELVDSGTPLPEGLTVEAFLDMTFRRA